MYDVITIGGATLDIFLDIHEASEHCAIKKDEGGEWFCVKRGEKVPVNQLHFQVGGNAANVAVGLARLRINVATYVHYGSDEISHKILNTLKAEGVATDYMVEDKDASSSIGLAINFQGERTLFTHHLKREHTLPNLSAPHWLYLTSIGGNWEHVYAQVVTFARENNVKIAFNPGSHQLERGVDSFMEQVKQSSILFVNKEEGEAIVKHTTKDLKTLLVSLQQLGPHVVSVTDGAAGAYAIDETVTMYKIERFPSTPVERTGAGDSYATGFLAAVVHGLPVPEAMRWGAVNAASVISFSGAQSGLLKKEAMEKTLSEHPELKATSL